MKVLVSKIVLVIPHSDSLKDKRMVLKSVKDRVWSKFRASIAEVEDQDSRQRAVLGLSFVSNDATLLESVMNKTVELIEAGFPGILHDYEHIIEHY
jgi:uncharacterized protein YlxP (DUF503 family)